MDAKTERVKAILDKHCWEFEQLKHCNLRRLGYGGQLLNCWGCNRNTKMAEAVVEEVEK